MRPAGGGSEATSHPPSRPASSPDIDIVPPRGRFPLSRGAPERKLERTNRYDRRAEVTAFQTLASTGTVRICLRVIDGNPFVFQPGYFIGIQATVPEHGVCRSPYCISSCPNAEGTFQLLVRLVPEGPLSYYLGGLTIGDVVSFRGPSGRSMVPKETDTDLVFLATGVGIGPFLGLVRHLLAQGFDRRIDAFWGLRLADDVCLTDELDALARDHGNVSYQISLSRPPPWWTGLRGRLTEAVPRLLATLGQKHYYLVGNGAMIEEMDAALSDLGVDPRLVYHEAFFNGRHRPEPEVMVQIRSRFVASDLFSPYVHQQAGLFLPESPVSRRGSAAPSAG